MRAVPRILHRWLGLLLVPPLAVLGITGALLAFEPTSRGSATSPPVTVSADEIVAAARTVAPDDLYAIRYVPPTSATPAEVWFAPASGPRGRGTLMVRVDPVTMLPIWPPEAPDGMLEWSRRLHGEFLLPNYGGRSIVGWVGVGLVLLCLMGVPIWWPAASQWRSAFSFSTAERGYRFHRRLHGAAGIWAVVLLLIFGATGAVLGFPRSVREVLGVPADSPPRATRSEPAAAAPVRRLDAALTLAAGVARGAEPRMVFLPAATGGPFRIVLAPRGGEGASVTSTVTVDAAAARVLGLRDPGTLPPVERTLRWRRDIHSAQGQGAVWRGLAIVAGLVLPVFAVTGSAMWLLRTRNRKRLGAAQHATLSAGQ